MKIASLKARAESSEKARSDMLAAGVDSVFFKGCQLLHFFVDLQLDPTKNEGKLQGSGWSRCYGYEIEIPISQA